MFLAIFPLWYNLVNNKLAKEGIGQAGVQVCFVWLFESITTTSFRVFDCTDGTTGTLVMDPSLPCPLDTANGGNPVPALLGVVVLVFYIVVPYCWFYKTAMKTKVIRTFIMLIKLLEKIGFRKSKMEMFL